MEAYQVLEDEKYVTLCTHYTNPVYSTQFNPSFNYTYECSSALLVAYIPVYVYTYTILSIFPPILYLLIAKIPKHFIPELMIYKIIKILRPQDWDENNKEQVILRANSIQALFVQHITLILTFGLASPFLAVIICIAIFLNTYGWQYIILRFINYRENKSTDVFLSDGNELTSELLFESMEDTKYHDDKMNLSRNERDEKLSQLEIACKDSWLSLMHSFWLVFYFCMFFYCFVLFDIVGDSHGLDNAILIPIIIASTIIFIRFTSFDIVYQSRIILANKNK